MKQKTGSGESLTNGQGREVTWATIFSHLKGHYIFRLRETVPRVNPVDLILWFPSHSLPEVGKVTLKSYGDEALGDEFLLKSNGDEAFNAEKKIVAMKRWRV